MLRLLIACIALLSSAFATGAATIPKADKQGARDNPLLKRYEGSLIVSHDKKSFVEFTLPLSKLEPVADRRDAKNNRLVEAKRSKRLEGAYTRLVYLIPADRSPLEVLRNYQEEIRSRGGSLLFECADTECGGDAQRSSYGGGGTMSLSMVLRPGDRVTDPYASTGHCSVMSDIIDQRYAAAELPDGAHVSVLTYSVKDNHLCKALNERTIAVVDIVEAKAREQRMVTVQAAEMARSLADTGRIALYGIYFDFNKADVKPESDPTLDEMAKLLKASADLKLLVVGHTDNVGSHSSNMDLSQRRAVAVVNVLATRYAIARQRLTPVGVSFSSPIATNKTDDGRARNRRVELVEN